MFKTVSFILFGLATSALISAASLPPFDSTNAATAVAVDADMPVFKSQLKIKGVGYSNIIDNQLVLSTFDGTPIFGKDAVFTIPEPSMLMFATHKVSPKKMEGAVVTWPNAVSAASASLFGKEGMLVPGGFLVPGKGDGGVWYAPKGGDAVKLFGAKGWFYHQATEYDINGDGYLEIVSCRAKKPLFGGGSGDLVYLEPLDRSNITGTWKETVVGTGCDTYFILEDVTGDGVIDLVAAEFWGEKLTLIQAPGGVFSDASKLTYSTIDDKLGPIFDLEFVDVNGDGKKEILATNHDGKGKGGVYAYEITPKGNSTWKRHDLAVGFPILQSGIAQAAPGTARSFFPSGSDRTSLKPLIAVAGDGSQKAYVMVPKNKQDSNDWSYDLRVIHDCKCTVGGMAVGDANQDGKTEIYVSCYDKGYVATYSY